MSLDWDLRLKEGADKERKRIRRAQAKALKVLRAASRAMPFSQTRVNMVVACSDLDRSTRRKRGRK